MHYIIMTYHILEVHLSLGSETADSQVTREHISPFSVCVPVHFTTCPMSTQAATVVSQRSPDGASLETHVYASDGSGDRHLVN